MKRTIYESAVIIAPKERIWEALIGESSFQEWCAAFSPGSYFVGDWSEGSKISFLGPAPDGKVGGMVSRVTDHRPGEYLRLEHYGVVIDGAEVFEGEVCDEWTPASEVYSLTGEKGQFTLSVETDVPEAHYDSFRRCWVQALVVIKQISERA